MAKEWLTYVVANTVDPYAYELPVIVAYPTGFRYRARFKREWVEGGLLGRLPELNRSTALIVYRHFESGRLYPIRYGIVRAIERYGDVVYLEYELGDLVAYHESAPKRKAQVQEFNRDWAAEHPTYAAANILNNHMRPLVFQSKYWPKVENPYLPNEQQAREFESWSNLCELVAEIPLYASMEFWRIIDMRDEGTDAAIAPEGRRYRLRSDSIYELRVAQQVFRAPELVRPHDLSFEADGHGIHALTQKRRAVGKYDVLSFRFRTAETEGSRRTGMIAVNGDMKPGEPMRLEVLTEIRPRWRLISSVGALVGAIAVLYPEAVSSLGVPTTWKIIVERIGTVLLVISVVDSRSIWLQLLRR